MPVNYPRLCNTRMCRSFILNQQQLYSRLPIINPPPGNPVQWVLWDQLYQDQTSLLWYYPDGRGDQLRPLHLGAALFFNGVNNDVPTVVYPTPNIQFHVYGVLHDYLTSGASEFKTLGARDMSNNTRCYIGSHEGKWVSGYGDQFSTSAENADGDYHHFFYDKGDFYVDDVLVTSASSGVFASQMTVPFLLGNQQINGFSSWTLDRVSINDLDSVCFNFEDAPAGSTSTTVYDVSGEGNHGTIQGAIDANTRKESIQIQSDQNLLGYNENAGTYIPVDQSAANLALPKKDRLDVNGDPLEFWGRARYDLQAIGATGTPKYLENDGTTVKQQDIPELWAIAQNFTNDVWYNGGETGVVYLHSDYESNFEGLGIWFSDVHSKLPAIKNHVVYGEEQKGDDLTKALEYVNASMWVDEDEWDEDAVWLD